MTSIRRFLVYLLAATFALTSFVAAVQAYHSGSRSLRQLLDQHLIDYALVLAQQDATVSRRQPVSSQTSLAYQIVSRDGLVLGRSASAPDMPLMALSQGFDEVNFGGQRWRALATRVDAERWVLVAEPLRLRDRVTDALITEMLWPMLVAIPLAALLIWLVVGRGLNPLLQLSARLQRRQADTLEPISLAVLPSELQPVLAAINDWQDRLKRAFERERHFASDAAHELRTPVSTLKIHLHNLQRQSSGDAAHWQPVQRAVADLEHLIEQMLMLYRTAPDQYLARHERLDLAALAREVIAGRYDDIDRKRQTITLEAPSVCVDGNRFALAALLDNLVSNAGKYTPEGGEIIVSLSARAGVAEVTVEDSGPGIPPERRDIALERFQRLQHGSGDIPGCGLGLAIVRHVVERHGGHIRLDESPRLHGLRVCVQLPLPPEDT